MRTVLASDEREFIYPKKYFLYDGFNIRLYFLNNSKLFLFDAVSLWSSFSHIKMQSSNFEFREMKTKPKSTKHHLPNVKGPKQL